MIFFIDFQFTGWKAWKQHCRSRAAYQRRCCTNKTFACFGHIVCHMLVTYHSWMVRFFSSITSSLIFVYMKQMFSLKLTKIYPRGIHSFGLPETRKRKESAHTLIDISTETKPALLSALKWITIKPKKKYCVPLFSSIAVQSAFSLLSHWGTKIMNQIKKNLCFMSCFHCFSMF